MVGDEPVSYLDWGPQMAVFEEQLLELALARARAAEDAVMVRDYAAASAHSAVAEAYSAVAVSRHALVQAREARELLFGVEPGSVTRPDLVAGE